MKKQIFFSAMVLYFSFNCLGQAPDKNSLLQKSKNQRTAAFVLLGLGATLEIGGLAASVSNADKQLIDLFSTQQPRGVNHTAEYILYTTGAACLVSSLILFNSSKSNKKKGLALGIDSQQIHQLKKGSLYTVKYPAVTMKIKLGK